MNLSEHFSEQEFTCHCGCGLAGIDPQLIVILEIVRKWANAPIKITSGRRCYVWNAAVGGVKSSQHLRGTAADIQVEGKSPAEVASFINSLPEFEGGIGIYNTFTHVDVRHVNARWDNT